MDAAYSLDAAGSSGDSKGNIALKSASPGLVFAVGGMILVYEWKREGKQKLAIYFRQPDEQPFALAGLWERWNDIESCTILTTAANGLMQPFHDRMPVILSPHDYDIWLEFRFC